jgi:hypothetical protein
VWNPAAATPRQCAADAHRGGAGHRDHRHAYAIGLWGDLPYSDLQKTVGVPNLIADMNRQRLAFTVHDGDIKAAARRAPTTSIRRSRRP